jgi:hypothetical protein
MNSAKTLKMPTEQTDNLANLLFEGNLRFLSTGPLWNVVTYPIPDGLPLPHSAECLDLIPPCLLLHFPS